MPGSSNGAICRRRWRGTSTFSQKKRPASSLPSMRWPTGKPRSSVTMADPRPSKRSNRHEAGRSRAPDRRDFQILAYACEYDGQADIRRRVERLERLMVERRPTPDLRSNKALHSNKSTKDFLTKLKA